MQALPGAIPAAEQKKAFFDWMKKEADRLPPESLQRLRVKHLPPPPDREQR